MPRGWPDARRRSRRARTPLSTACTCTGGPVLLAAMAEGGQVLVPTLSGYYWMAGPGDADAEQTGPAAEMTPMLAGVARRNVDEGAATLRAARDAGVKIALGSDVSLGTGARNPADDPPRAHPRGGAGGRDQHRCPGTGPGPNTSAPWQKASSPTC